MKRSKVIRKLVKLLKTWECSKLSAETAREILDLLTSPEIDMLPPYVQSYDYNADGSITNCKWETE